MISNDDSAQNFTLTHRALHFRERDFLRKGICCVAPFKPLRPYSRIGKLALSIFGKPEWPDVYECVIRRLFVVYF